jgi:pimeloyl-ACP methyl ester carboxylesterase
VDLRGQGETGPGERGEQLGDWKTYYLAYLLGKSLTGMRIEDAFAVGHFAGVYQGHKNEPLPVHLVGVGQAGIVALHAAALRPELFASVTLHDAPHDWSSVLRQTNPAGHLDSTVHGALEVYDLPDLIRLIGEEKVSYDK